MATATLAASGDVAAVAVPGIYPSVFVSLNGTYGGLTGVFEVSPDGTVWTAVSGFNNDTQGWETGPSALTNATRSWYLSVPGVQQARLRATALASGSVAVSLTPGAAVSLPSGGTSATGLPVTTPGSLVKTVAAAGTPEALAAAGTYFQSATLVGNKAARTANVGTVYLGVASGNDTQFIPITTGQLATLQAPAGQKYDLGSFYLDVVTNGDGLSVVYS